jgi:hypothetical protein
MKPDRRTLLLTGAAALAAQSPVSAAADGEPLVGLPMAELARLKPYRALRSSSFDKTGANNDWVQIDPGATATLLETNGPGIVTHIWITINSPEPFHLKKLVLRAYWDNEKEPSVEVPVGDFFGLSLGDYFLYQSALTTVSSVKALNSYFTMPFARSARITVSNEGTQPARSFYFNVDHVSLKQLPSDLAYFHAQYRQATPCTPTNPPNPQNPLGKDNYVFMEAQGRGHFIGVTHGVVQTQEGWWGEGDEMIFIDGADHPVINGTGTEDYYNGAWDFGGSNSGTPFAYLRNGAPFMANPEHTGGRWCLYRWHLEDAIPFDKSIKVTIEHGHANDRADNFYSTAYWYQTEPHAAFPPLPPAQDRVPVVRQAK